MILCPFALEDDGKHGYAVLLSNGRTTLGETSSLSYTMLITPLDKKVAPMNFPLLSDYFRDDYEIEVINPATQKSLGHIKSYSVDEVQICIEKADAAQKNWAAYPAKECSEILRQWFNLIMENQEELAKILTAECGKPIKESCESSSFWLFA